MIPHVQQSPSSVNAIVKYSPQHASTTFKLFLLKNSTNFGVVWDVSPSLCPKTPYFPDPNV